MINAEQWFGQAPGGGGYQIERSLRFNAPDSAYLSRTPSVAGNRKTWTWAGWVKRSALGSTERIFSAGSGTSYTEILFVSDALKINCQNSGSDAGQVQTQAVLRDPSAWYHCVISFNATGTSKIYVNGIEQPLSTTTGISNIDHQINNTVAHRIGSYFSGGNYFNGYLADVHFIDGQALDPTSFGEFDANGVWQPIDASGLTYGTNGFHLPFSDNSTAAALGTDTSGNGNTWTVTNLNAVTAGYQPYTLQATKIGGMPGNISNIFDGSLTGSAQLDPNSFSNYGGFTISPPITGSVIRLYGISVNTGANNLRINNSTYYTLPNPAGFITISETSVNRIEGQSAGGGGTYLYAIEVDGVLLLDTYLFQSDSLVDVPVNGSAPTDTDVGNSTKGNYSTINPLSFNGSATLTNGNLQYSVAGSTPVYASSTIGATSGKYYVEVTAVNVPAASYPNWTAILGVGSSPFPSSIPYYYSNDGNLGGFLYSTWKTGDVIGILINLDAGSVSFKKNNVSVSGLGGLSTSSPIFLMTGARNGGQIMVNFGQFPFIYSQSNYKALCTTNLPEPLIAKPSEVMDVVTYIGNGGTQTISGLGFSPDFVWSKGRNNTSNHALIDIVRGGDKVLISDVTDSEYTGSYIQSFDSTGYTLNSTSSALNLSGYTYVAWAWDAGSSTVTNTQGSITSQVRANASAGFSVVTFTKSSGSGTAETIGHGLNVAPHLIILKARDVSDPWYVYHNALGNNARVQLNETSAQTVGTSLWGTTSPTSSVFTVQGVLTGSKVAYCFAPVAGYSSFGSYTGNGSADGPFVYTGFRPRWVMIKRTDTTNYWIIQDAARNGFNVVNLKLAANTSNAENHLATIGDTSQNTLDYLSNGFKCRTGNAGTNASGGTYVWAAFAESPFQYARAR